MLTLTVLSLLLPAQLPVLASSARLDASRHGALLFGSERVGLSVSLPVELGSVVLEGSYALHHAHAQLSAAQSFRLFEKKVIAGAAQLGASSIATTRGPLHLGAGPHAGLSFGVGDRVQAVFALSFGAELYAGGGGSALRAPGRAALGLVLRPGWFRLELWGRLGADFIPGLSATAKYEAVLALGVVLP